MVTVGISLQTFDFLFKKHCNDDFNHRYNKDDPQSTLLYSIIPPISNIRPNK